jgi:hypothetical protein
MTGTRVNAKGNAGDIPAIKFDDVGAIVLLATGANYVLCRRKGAYPMIRTVVAGAQRQAVGRSMRRSTKQGVSLGQMLANLCDAASDFVFVGGGQVVMGSEPRLCAPRCSVPHDFDNEGFRDLVMLPQFPFHHQFKVSRRIADYGCHGCNLRMASSTLNRHSCDLFQSLSRTPFGARLL